VGARRPLFAKPAVPPGDFFPFLTCIIPIQRQGPIVSQLKLGWVSRSDLASQRTAFRIAQSGYALNVALVLGGVAILLWFILSWRLQGSGPRGVCHGGQITRRPVTKRRAPGLGRRGSHPMPTGNRGRRPALRSAGVFHFTPRAGRADPASCSRPASSPGGLFICGPGRSRRTGPYDLASGDLQAAGSQF
jgi:hypothetical protein